MENSNIPIDVFMADSWACCASLYFTCSRLYSRWPTAREKYIKGRIEAHHNLQQIAAHIIWNNTKLYHRYISKQGNVYSLYTVNDHIKCNICNIFKITILRYENINIIVKFKKYDIINNLVYIIEVISDVMTAFDEPSLDDLYHIVDRDIVSIKVFKIYGPIMKEHIYKCILKISHDSPLLIVPLAQRPSNLSPPIDRIIQYMTSETINSMEIVGKWFFAPKNELRIYSYI